MQWWRLQREPTGAQIDYSKSAFGIRTTAELLCRRQSITRFLDNSQNTSNALDRPCTACHTALHGGSQNCLPPLPIPTSVIMYICSAERTCISKNTKRTTSSIPACHQPLTDLLLFAGIRSDQHFKKRNRWSKRSIYATCNRSLGKLRNHFAIPFQKLNKWTSAQPDLKRISQKLISLQQEQSSNSINESVWWYLYWNAKMQFVPDWINALIDVWY